MTFFEFKIGEDDVDRRIDKVVRKFLNETPLSIVYKNIRSGFIRVNSTKVKNDYRMKNGDVLFIEKNFFLNNEVQIKKNSLLDTQLLDVHFETIFENEHILIINKPFGINVQAATVTDISLDKIIKNDFQKKIDQGIHKTSLSFTPGPLHRLDKNTTGVLAFSQSLQGARYFSQAMSDHCVKKEYIALLSGSLSQDVHWTHAIEKSIEQKENSFITVNVHELTSEAVNTKVASTHVTPLAHGVYYNEAITLVKIHIDTGRTHQIRSQAGFCSYPLLGDSAYGYKGNCPQFFLHAFQLEFQEGNPIGLPKKVYADLPNSFKEMIKQHLPNVVIPSYNSK